MGWTFLLQYNLLIAVPYSFSVPSLRRECSVARVTRSRSFVLRERRLLSSPWLSTCSVSSPHLRRRRALSETLSSSHLLTCGGRSSSTSATDRGGRALRRPAPSLEEPRRRPLAGPLPTCPRHPWMLRGLAWRGHSRPRS
jgi:hypothetical protein